MEPRRRRLSKVVVSVAVPLVVALGSGVPAASAQTAGQTLRQLAQDGSFERGLKGWKGHRAALTLVSGGAGDARAVRVSIDGAQTNFSIYRWPRPVSRTRARTVYVARAWVRSLTAGTEVCLRIRESRSRRTIGSARACLTPTAQWRLVRVRYQARRGGSKLGVSLYKKRPVDQATPVDQSQPVQPDSFDVDKISVTNPEPRPVTEPTAEPTTTRPRAPAPGVGVMFHCMWSSYTNAQRLDVLDKLAAAGVTWVRIDIGWRSIELAGKGDRNAWAVSTIDFCVDEARKRGINVLGMLWLTPDWANGGRGELAPPNNPQDYGDLARWAAAHWAGRVSAWEVWNEPNSQDFWKGTPEQYTQLLRAAYPALKAGDPRAQVLFAGVMFNDVPWIARAYAAGAQGAFDVMATHPYMAPSDLPPETATPDDIWKLSHVKAVHDLMVRYGDGDKPIWFTEMGWSTHANWTGVHNSERGVTLAQQGDYMVRSIKFVANYPYVKNMFFYNERDNGTTSSQYDNYGVLYRDLSPKPAYFALKRYLAAS